MKKRRPRNPWLAVLFSLALGGLGQLYNGQLLKAVLFFLVAQFVVFPPLIYLNVKGIVSFEILLVVLGLSLAWEVVMAVDAWLVAKRERAYALRAFNRWYIYLLILIIVSTPFLMPPVLKIFPQPFKVPSSSMEPTLLPGDFFFSNSKAESAKRGDIVVFKIPTEKEKLFVKRVIGLPGDIVETTSHGIIIVNGERLPHTLVTSTAQGNSFQMLEENNGVEYIINAGPNLDLQKEAQVVVPMGHLFVMGDNRPNSFDSRFFGPIPIKEVKGVAQVIYFSLISNNKPEIRWDRIGKKLSNPHPM
ncbi:MAG TPA: signal peptidase I [Bdellovibrionota bacterium]|nr:signal peptidase I [Bdellovibrionota bacterium]